MRDRKFLHQVGFEQLLGWLCGDRNREGGALVPAGDGEVPGWAGKTGMCTGTSIPGHGDEGDVGPARGIVGAAQPRRGWEGTIWESLSKREGFEQCLRGHFDKNGKVGVDPRHWREQVGLRISRYFLEG